MQDNFYLLASLQPKQDNFYLLASLQPKQDNFFLLASLQPKQDNFYLLASLQPKQDNFYLLASLQRSNIRQGFDCRTRLIVIVMVFNVTFKNISVKSWRSVLLVEETGVSRENYRPAASH